MTLPKFLRLSVPEQRLRFQAITAQCEEHIEQALAQPTSNYSFIEALQPKNRPRNRYVNVLPWDRTRVVLKADGALDYINASWVQLGPNRYIAAQGPLKNTIAHFWAMCFQQAQHQESLEVLIAMVTPLLEQGREKCAKYWPSQGTHWDLSAAAAHDNLATSMKVKWVGQEALGDTLLTRLELEVDGVKKEVLHHHYRGWADTQRPENAEPLIHLSKHVAYSKKRFPRLVPIVHCSAGVGRTGTFIAIDHFLTSDVLQNGDDPVLSTVSAMREQRIMMVQTVHQYTFLYDAAGDLYRDQLSKSEGVLDSKMQRVN